MQEDYERMVGRVREKKYFNRPPPMYKPVGVYLTVVIHYGGKFISNPMAKYDGGSVRKLDYVDAKQLCLESFKNYLTKCLSCEEDVKVYILLKGNFQLLLSDEEVRKWCKQCIGVREVSFYVEEGDKNLSGEGSFKTRMITECDNDESDELCDSDYDMVEESDDDDDDDLLYHANVSKNLSDDSSDNSEDDDDVVNVDKQIFDEYKDSDDEEHEPDYPIFNSEVIFEPNFELGMLFSSREEFKLAVQSHAIKTKRSLKMTKTSPTRTYIVCSDKNCKWNIHLNKVKGEDTFQIRQYVDTHTCIETFHVQNLKSKWLSQAFLKKFAVDRKRKAEPFRKDVINKLKCDVSIDQAFRAKRLALKKLEGDPDMQYSKLWEYSEELRRTNPGSTIILGCEEDENGNQRFKNFYVCFDAVIKGFEAGCRRIIGVDGCHLKGPHKGILLTAVSVDANNNLFPLSWAVVNRESRETWEWFLTVLRHDLHLYDDFELTFMSDKQKGLIQAMREVFPHVEHRFCVRHLHGNFKSAGFIGLAFKTFLWNAAQAGTVGEWKDKMLELKSYNEAAWKLLAEKPAEQWSKSHFGEQSKCDMLLNNVCESFNATILEAREMSILTMLDWIRQWMMARFQRQRDIAHLKWKGRICPRIKRILEKHVATVSDCIPIKGDNSHYEIKCSDGGQFLVDLDVKSCSCWLWGLSGIPCKHAICAINHQKGNKDDYVDDVYTIETFQKIYAATIKGINGQQLWGESSFIPPLPPTMGRGKGRPASQRRKESDEPKNSKKKKVKLKRRQQSLKCSECGIQGHNALTCGRNTLIKRPRKKLQVRKKKKDASGSSSSILPPVISEICDEEQPAEEHVIAIQRSHVQSEPASMQPGPSMYSQILQGNSNKQGLLILSCEERFL